MIPFPFSLGGPSAEVLKSTGIPFRFFRSPVSPELLPFSRYGNLDPSVDSVPVLPGRRKFDFLTSFGIFQFFWKFFWKKFQVFHFFGLFPFFWTLGNCTMQKLEQVPHITPTQTLKISFFGTKKYFEHSVFTRYHIAVVVVLLTI